MAVVEVVGRDAELLAIRGLLEARGGGLLLTGEPGIGKTVLWETGVAAARDAGWRVLQHRSVQAEAGLAFAGLSDLVAPAFEEVVGGLAAPRRRALEVALQLAEPGPTAPDSLTLGLALIDVLRALAIATPVLVALDDAQWLDAPSASVLAIALRRLDTEPVVILTTRRTEPGETAAAASLGGRDARLTLAPLDLGATERMLRARLGGALDQRALAAIYRVSAGNPYFASELAAAGVDASGVRVPPSLQELLGGRVTRLPRRVQDVLLEAAALARPTVGLLGGDLGALDAAIVDGILRIDGADVRFAHPLLASIAYDGAPPGQRRAMHARLADRVDDPEERARHRALAAGDGPAPALAAELETAGRRASSRGAPATAAELIELAVSHTPQRDGERGRARRRAAADLHHLAGDLERAGELYDELIAELPAGNERAGVLYAKATLQRGDAASRIVLCRRALDELGDDDALASRALGFIAINRWIGGDTAGGLADARAALAHAERVAAPRLVATAIARVAMLEIWQLDVTPGLVERGIEIEASLDEPLRFNESPSFAYVVMLTLSDEIDAARELQRTLVAALEQSGDEPSRGWHLLEAIQIERYAGRYAYAMEHSRRTIALAEQIGDPHLLLMGCAFTCAVLTDQGEDDELHALVQRGLVLVEKLGDADTRLILDGAVGGLALARGDLRAAAATLDGVPARAIAGGHLHPASLPWADTIETLIGLGRLDEAESLLSHYESLARRTSRWARATAARCRGLLLLARSDGRGAVAALERSLAEEAGTYPLERGRTLLALGTAHRLARGSRRARDELDRAVAIFADLGAAAWHERALAERGRVAGRRPGGDELTAAERRVAELAARGRRNKEIAAELYLTVGTVEMHLSRVYRKLGLRSRTELAGHVRDGG